jgi:alkylation response protein AidB-like acyl-CoA dehydrogenase
MDFELSDEQQDIQRAAKEFAQGEFDPDLALELDQAGQFPESIWKKASRLGFMGIHYPADFGGQGLGYFESVLVSEAFCRVDSGIGSALGMVEIGSEVILKFGSNEQKKRFLPPLAKGEKRLSFAFSESEYGKDFSSAPTIAERREGDYLIRGTARRVINAVADGFVVLCKEPKEGWITLIVEKRNGIKVHPIEKMGLRLIPFGDLQFQGIRVPHENRIEGEGMAHVGHCHQAKGIRNSAQALGMAQGAFDRAVQHSKQREQFGRKLSQFQVIRHKLADMAVAIEVARWFTYQSAMTYDHGRTDSGFLSMTLLEVGRRLLWVVDEALQIFGGYGYIVDESIEHYFRDARSLGVELGTEEELRDSIAEVILGSDAGKK